MCGRGKNLYVGLGVGVCMGVYSKMGFLKSE